MYASKGLPGVVASTEPRDREYGKPRTVRKIFDLKQFAIEYFDKSGELHRDVVVQLGDSYFMAPNGEEWTEALRPCARWLLDEMGARVSGKGVPNKDSVNITGKKTKTEVAG